MRPIIGVTLDWDKGCEAKGTFSRRPYYALRESYFGIIYKAGGLPLAIPYITEAIDEYLDKISGLLIPGGDFAFKKEWYVNPDEEKPYQPSKRLDFDIAIANRALDRDVPLLGICAGMQVLGCISGAKMTPNVNKHLNTSIDHRNHKPADQVAHDVKVAANSKLYSITGKDIFAVNTAHSEAIVETPENVLVSGVSEDGAIEAIEIKNKEFAIGVQWHPEFFPDNTDPSFLIVKALVDKAREKM